MSSLSEQVRELEADVRLAVSNADKWQERYQAAESRLAQAEIDRDAWIQAASAASRDVAQARAEGARELVARYVSQNSRPEMTGEFFRYLSDLERFRDREYPAPATGEQGKAHCGCWADRAPNEPCVCPRIGEQWATRAWHCDTCKRGGTGAVMCSEQKCNATRNKPSPVERVTPSNVIAAFISPIDSSRWQGGLVNVTEDGAWWGYNEVQGKWEQMVGPVSLAAQDGGTRDA